MPAVFPIFENAAFTPEVTQAMGEAFDRACSVIDGGQIPPIVKEAIANRVLEEAWSGEHDPNRLLMAALKGMGI